MKKIMKQRKKVRRDARVWKEENGHEKNNPEGLSHPDQNIKTINIIL